MKKDARNDAIAQAPDHVAAIRYDHSIMPQIPTESLAMDVQNVMQLKRSLYLTFLAIGFLVWGGHAFGQSPSLVSRDAPWKYRATVDDPPSDWNQPTFDDSDWRIGVAGFGYGDQDDRTVLSKMVGRFTRVQIRTEFNIDDSADVQKLYLYVDYDDGFVAFINGVEIQRAKVTRQGTRVSVGLHEAAGFEEFMLSIPEALLRTGRNVLAVEGYNQSLGSSDFSLHPVLALRRMPALGESVSRLSAIADIDELQRRIEDQSSYVHRNRFDHRKAFDELRRSITADESVFLLAEKIQRLVAKIGDCHANIRAPSSDSRARYLPFSLADTRDGIAAIKIDRSALVSPDYPFVDSIDGIPVDRWLEIESAFVADGSPQFIRQRSLAGIRRVDRVRRYLELPSLSQAVVKLRSSDGLTVNHTVVLVDHASPVGRVPLARSRILDANIGYLRIDQMDNELKKSIAQTMAGFKNTVGLIIDVRDNGGGRYGLLELMHGYLTPADEPPYVTNLAAYRKSLSFGEDHLHYRPTFREDHKRWNDNELAAIKRARQDFQPEWNPPQDLFSEWHYMVVNKTKNLGQYHYDKPVVVLCNAGSFSATDGFLSCMADIPGVILLGQPSGGGSGATRRFRLPTSGIRVALSSMASFRPNGKLFDGNGIPVDVAMKPSVSDFLGKSDTVRSKAIVMIRTRTNESKSVHPIDVESRNRN